MAKQQLEAALDELESVARELESGNLSLAEAIKKYKSGLTLVEKCRKELDTARAQLKVLTQTEDGIAEEDMTLKTEETNG